MDDHCHEGPVELPTLTESGIDEAQRLLVDAELNLSNFEQQIVRNWCFWKVSFIDEETATNLADRFELFLNKAVHVEGSMAWIRMIPVTYKEPPNLDELMSSNQRFSAGMIRRVLRDRKNDLNEVEQYYRDEKRKLRAQATFDDFCQARSIAEGTEN